MIGVSQRLGLSRLGSGGSRFISHGFRARGTRLMDELTAAVAPTGTRMGSNIIPTQGMEWQGVGLQVGADVTGGGGRMGQPPCPEGAFYNTYTGVCQYPTTCPPGTFFNDVTGQCVYPEDPARGDAFAWAELLAPLGVDLLNTGMSTWAGHARGAAAFDIIRDRQGYLSPWEAQALAQITDAAGQLPANRRSQFENLRAQQRQDIRSGRRNGARGAIAGELDPNTILLLVGGVALIALLSRRKAGA